MLDNHKPTHITKKCTPCDKIFKQSSYYHHLKVCKAYNCDKCDFQAKGIMEFRKHRTQHQRQNEFKCTQCDYTSSGKFNINRHILAVHGDKYKCDECGKPVLLAKAEKHKEKHARKFECKDCL